MSTMLRTSQLRLLELDRREVPAVFTVTNVNDAGAGSLRQAILAANANPGLDSIAFAPTVFTGTQTIALFSTLPAVNGPLNITGPGSDVLRVVGGPMSGVPFNLFAAEAGASAAVSGLTVLGNSGLGGGLALGDDVRLSAGTTIPGVSIAADGRVQSTAALPFAGTVGALNAIVDARRFAPPPTFSFDNFVGPQVTDLSQFQSTFNAGIP